MEYALALDKVLHEKYALKDPTSIRLKALLNPQRRIGMWMQ
jgi:hypothetical protein